MELTAAPVRTASAQPVLGLPDPGEQVPRLAWPTVALYAGTLALFAAEAYGVLAGDWTRWLTVPMGAAVTFLMFSVLHEATHHAISTRAGVNTAFGRLAVPLVDVYATFAMIKFIHIEHHRNTNEPKSIDPDHWTEEGPAWQLPLRWATTDIWYLVFYLRRISERPRREAITTITVAIGVVAALVVLSVVGFGSQVLWLVIVPQRVGLVVLSWWFDYLPHHGLTVTQRQDRYRATRVRVGGEFALTPLLVYQNYHLVHHLHPSIPFYRYLRAWRRNERAYLDRNAAISTWFGRSLTPSEYRTWRRLTDRLDPGRVPGGARRPVFHPLRVGSVDRLTADSVTVTFEVPADLAGDYRYLPGQHLTVRAIIDGQDVRRSYSIVPPVSARTLRVAVKRIADGVFSAYANERLRAGDILDVMTPTGTFRIDAAPGAGRHVVAVAAGSGITPIMSILVALLATEPASRCTLLFGNRDAATTMFRDEIAALQRDHPRRFAVHHVLSAGDTEQRRRITAELLFEVAGDVADVAAWFLCGPQPLLDHLRAELAAVTEPGRVLTEIFHVESERSTEIAVDVESRVGVTLDGASTEFVLRSTGEPVLDAALRAGVDAPYSCAGGACGTCRARVLLGRAVMDQNHVLDAAALAAGYVLTCQAHPVTEELRLDYDA